MIKDQFAEVTERLLTHLNSSFKAIHKGDDEEAQRHYMLLTCLLSDILSKASLYEQLVVELAELIRNEEFKQNVLSLLAPIESDEVNAFQFGLWLDENFPS